MQRANWWKHAKIYELYIDKFAGTISGLTSKLDYFTHLGINTLHVLPHYPSPMVDDGYDVTDYQNVRPELGTLDDFKKFLNEAHSRDIYVIVDFVLNHVSSEHPWFVEARATRENPKRNFFLWSNTGQEFKNARNAFVDIKPSNWIKNELTEDYYYATFYPEQPDLNWDNPLVFEEMLQYAKFWVDLGVDGFRLDAVPFLIKRENSPSLGLPETHAILKKIRAQLDEKYSGRIALLGEAHQELRDMMQYFGDGDECHMLYHFPMMEQMLLALMRNDDSAVRTMVQASSDIPPSCEWAVFVRNHDDISLTTLPDADRMELVDFLDPQHRYPFSNHTTTSMRLGSIFENHSSRVLEALELLYSVPGVKVLYYGDEIGMKNLPLQEGVRDSRVYVRGEFDWNSANTMLADPDSLLNKVARCIKRSAA
ncbi:MAG: maltose alpha-D-glucosyltransferase [Parcubacteria group bacterium Gr01-1014_8]|nr:MAG: maltose alpha-D-glucosyltransferase [Parcubacteria group bacterium Gr01-1014_8]